MEVVETKPCIKCNETKPLEEFRIHNTTKNRRNVCKKCQRKSYSEWEKKPENRAKSRKYAKKWRDKNRNKWNGYSRKQAARPEMKRWKKQWEKDNAEKCKSYYKKYRQNPQVKIRETLRARFAVFVKGYSRSEQTRKFLGCSIEQLRSYIESLWQTGMTWDNYGLWKTGKPMTWHIDHIRPCASFDLADPEQQKICFHYKNMQPLWAVENIKKKDTYEPN